MDNVPSVWGFTKPGRNRSSQGQASKHLVDFLQRVLDQIEDQHRETRKDLKELKSKVEGLENFKWKVIGAATSATLIVQVVWVVASKYLEAANG